MHNPFEGKKVVLKALELSHADEIIKAGYIYETRKNLGGRIPESAERVRDKIVEQIKDASKGKSYNFSIFDKNSNEYLGTCAIRRIHPINRGASIRIAIQHPKNFGKGYGTDAMHCILRIGFNILNLHRIELQVFSFNNRAIHMYKKLGFTLTATRRESTMRDGKYHDIYIMDILKREYIKSQKDMEK